MLLTDLRRRDPNLIALRRAIRVAVAVPVSILVLVNIPATTETALFGVFACLALLLFGNFAGKWKLRAAAYLTATVVGGVVVALCSLLARTLWPAMMAMAVVALFISMFAMLRGYLAAAQNVVLLAAVLALTSAEPQQTPQILLAWTIGGLIGYRLIRTSKSPSGWLASTAISPPCCEKDGRGTPLSPRPYPQASKQPKT